jgi:hypothetical protein
MAALLDRLIEDGQPKEEFDQAPLESCEVVVELTLSVV